MEVQFTEFQGKEIIWMSNLKIIPRKGERIFINDSLYDVYKIFHHYDLESPKIHIEIELIKV